MTLININRVDEHEKSTMRIAFFETTSFHEFTLKSRICHANTYEITLKVRFRRGALTIRQSNQLLMQWYKRAMH